MPDPFTGTLFYVELTVAAAAKRCHGVVADVKKTSDVLLVSRKPEILIVVAGATDRLPVIILNSANTVGIATEVP
jgi:hypothetical protein